MDFVNFRGIFIYLSAKYKGSKMYKITYYLHKYTFS